MLTQGYPLKSALAGFFLRVFCSADPDSFLDVHGTWGLWCLQDYRLVQALEEVCSRTAGSLSLCYCMHTATATALSSAPSAIAIATATPSVTAPSATAIAASSAIAAPSVPHLPLHLPSATAEAATAASHSSLPVCGYCCVCVLLLLLCVLCCMCVSVLPLPLANPACILRGLQVLSANCPTGVHEAVVIDQLIPSTGQDTDTEPNTSHSHHS